MVHTVNTIAEDILRPKVLSMHLGCTRKTQLLTTCDCMPLNNTALLPSYSPPNPRLLFQLLLHYSVQSWYPGKQGTL
jgi:hypothetical protein